MAERVLIFDTTMRDGEQSPGATMTADDKVEIARALDRLGVDIIEAGFPFSSPGDFEAVQRVARAVRRPIIAGLAHANAQAVDACCDAVRVAERPRCHVFLSSSDVHLLYQLKKGPEEILLQATEMVARAKKKVSDVEFSPMDATRTQRDYLVRVLSSVIAAGATTINVPDTVGYTTPDEFYDLIRYCFEHVSGIEKVTVSVHCHNDLGLAVPNSLAAIRAGARQVECTINGIGERAGNASLEEIVMTLRTRHDLYGVETGIDTTKLYPTSRLVSDITGLVVQPNKAIVGGNAFRHESGIHQDGIIKNPITYEIMDPVSVGRSDRELYLGKLSGRAAVRKRLSELGYNLSDEELGKFFAEFKRLADTKKQVTDQDLEALMGEERREERGRYRLENLQAVCGSDRVHRQASVTLVDRDGKRLHRVAQGNGPVAAVFAAISQAVGLKPEPELLDYTVKSITGTAEAQGDVTVQLRADGVVVNGRGVSTDIVEASAKAYINALNRLLEAPALTSV
ncbi:MAG: 2-isopropylmalate synthase [Chloroflexi bacterium]|nr:2-isopropylmalate synthase [Chloroflexota bacterium]